MTTLTLQPSGKQIEVAPGTLLLQAILDAGEQIVVKCGGNASCGGCALRAQSLRLMRC